MNTSIRWHSRGYLPHFEAGACPQTVTFRLFDSIPLEVLRRWREELSNVPEADRERQHRFRTEEYLDAGQGGPTWLALPAIANLVERALLYFDGDRYRLHAWTIMPNHVHSNFTPFGRYSVATVLHSWKSFTAKGANELLGRTGPFWQREYFDRVIRDEKHFATAIAYIENNPVKAGLCRRAEDWAWGSARIRIGSLAAPQATCSWLGAGI